jgi:hypothetical protein
MGQVTKRMKRHRGYDSKITNARQNLEAHCLMGMMVQIPCGRDLEAFLVISVNRTTDVKVRRIPGTKSGGAGFDRAENGANAKIKSK